MGRRQGHEMQTECNRLQGTVSGMCASSSLMQGKIDEGVIEARDDVEDIRALYFEIRRAHLAGWG